MRRQRLGAYVVIGSAVVIVVGSFLPWLDLGSVRGTDAMDGWVTMAAGVGMLYPLGSAAVERGISIPGLRRVFGFPLWVIWVAWVVGAYVAGSRFVDLARFPGPSYVGVGLWAVLAGFVAAAVGVIVFGRSRGASEEGTAVSAE